MASMNQIMLSGRLGKDPEIHYFESGNCVGEFNIAVDVYAGKDGDQVKNKTMWMKCKAFGKKGEFVCEHFHQGDKVWLTGQLDNQKYTKDGVDHTTFHVVVDQIDKTWPPKQTN